MRICIGPPSRYRPQAATLQDDRTFAVLLPVSIQSWPGQWPASVESYPAAGMIYGRSGNVKASKSSHALPRFAIFLRSPSTIIWNRCSVPSLPGNGLHFSYGGEMSTALLTWMSCPRHIVGYLWNISLDKLQRRFDTGKKKAGYIHSVERIEQRLCIRWNIDSCLPLHLL